MGVIYNPSVSTPAYTHLCGHGHDRQALAALQLKGITTEAVHLGQGDLHPLDDRGTDKVKKGKDIWAREISTTWTTGGQIRS